MDDKLATLQKSIDDLKRQLTDLQKKVDDQQKSISSIFKDIGGQDSRNIYEIIYKMDGYMSRDTSTIDTIKAEVEDTRRTVTNLEIMVKDILRGMGSIYYAVDELEDNLVPERKTK